MAESDNKRLQPHPIIKFAILLHLFLMLSWSLPPAPTALLNGTVKPTLTNVLTNPADWILWGNRKFKDHSPTSRWVMWSGLWQYWDMFAPNPASVDIYLDSYVEYADGTTREVMYPRMYDLSIKDKYLMERYRKYVERVNGDNFAAKWPQLAMWMAAQAWTDPDNPPVHIRLRRNWRQVQGPGVPTPDGYNHYFFYEADIAREELERFKRW